ncbi:MAG: M23 family metallopeptidase [Paracoccus denitrificans]|uniref:M23 family metallopeptidase n=1 Tax=Paracoccus denitrificans TaxID=266 RepID=A0A533IAS1_PARDE|nr:MAG: M23 family metallopeptidase [Paracoccus denitrificans]
MSSRIFRGITAVSLSAVLAGCQSLPAVQQDLASIGAPSTATSFPGFGRAGAAATPAASGGTQVVTDPYAGQGVAQPDVPGGGASASQSGSTRTATAPATPARKHRVVAGETGWSISRKYGVTPTDLAAANGLDAAMTLRVGQELTIPATTATRVSDASVPGQGTPTPTPPSASQPLPDEKTAPSSTPVAKPATPDMGATRTAASGSGKFQMPVAGSIVRAYSKGSNDGIDLAAPTGTPVNAAAGGTVAAVTRDTDGVPIVVIRHQGELMTVYAGMAGLSVQKGDQVKAGQQIGTAGGAGSIHFEVRQGYDSVNPEGYF